MLQSNAKIHFVGIGGIGMSALAQVLLARGYIVTGSDVHESSLTKAISAKGGMVFEGHRESNIGDAQIVVYSSSISKDNPELAAARKKGVQIMHRSGILAELMKDKDGIAVTGAHGKTTTTAMIAQILIQAGLDPLCVLGGESFNVNSNAYAGKGRFMVAEADESDGTHLALSPKYAVITNLDREHMDFYENDDNIIKINLSFIEKIRKDGSFFGLVDDYFIKKMLVHYNGRFKTFGLSAEADIHAVNIELQGMGSRFDCMYDKQKIGAIRLNIPGRHNIFNALAAALVSLAAGVDFKTISCALEEFKSSKRRFQIHSKEHGITVMEDYAHHPTEIKATLAACRLQRPKRLITVFQPHRYSRTKDLAKAFGRAFGETNELILTSIYAASEMPLEGVSVKKIFDEVKKNGHGNAHIIPKDNIIDYLYDTARAGDFIAVLGAGDIGFVARELSERLKKDEGGF